VPGHLSVPWLSPRNRFLSRAAADFQIQIYYVRTARATFACGFPLDFRIVLMWVDKPLKAPWLRCSQMYAKVFSDPRLQANSRTGFLRPHASPPLNYIAGKLLRTRCHLSKYSGIHKWVNRLAFPRNRWNLELQASVHWPQPALGNTRSWKCSEDESNYECPINILLLPVGGGSCVLPERLKKIREDIKSLSIQNNLFSKKFNFTATAEHVFRYLNSVLYI